MLMLNRKKIITILAPIVLVLYLGINHTLLSKLETDFVKKIADQSKVTIDFTTKNILSNSLEVQLSHQNTTALAYLSPSYFRAAVNYQLTVEDISPEVTDLIHYLPRRKKAIFFR